MTDETQLRNSVIDALADQKGTKANDYFAPDEIANNIENRTGEKPSLMTLMAFFANSGATALNLLTIGGGYWKFGPGKPPRSQEIPAPGRVSNV